MGIAMTRQAEYQKRMREQCRCQICGKPEFVKGYCEVHQEQRMARLRSKNGAGGALKTCSHCQQEGHNRRGCPVRRLEESRGVYTERIPVSVPRGSDAVTRALSVRRAAPAAKIASE